MTVKKSKQYEVKRIFIGSPGDVPKERKIFPEVITRVNRLKANSMGVQLEAIGWEDTLPGKGRPRPQSNINEDLLKCDLIIMLLWNRWGSSTGKYSSGFEEEYELANSNRKGIWIFFKDISKEMLADPGDQLKKVIEFRDRIEKERKYFFVPYKNEKEWKDKLEEYLCDWLDKIGPVPPSGALPNTPPGFQGLQDAADYKRSLSKLGTEVDEYISKQIENANELAMQAAEFANEGRISKAEEYYTKALSITNDSDIINKFAQFLTRIGKLDQAKEKFNLMMEIANSTNDDKLKSIVFNNKAVIYRIKGDLIESEKLLIKALKMDKELGDKEGVAAAYGNLGTIKAVQGEFKEAENLYNKSLKIDEKLDHKEGMAVAYLNLGNVKRLQEDMEEAEILYNKSIELNKELGDKEGIAATLGNLGIIKDMKGELEEAENLYNKALELNKELGDKEGMAVTLGNLGILKKNQGYIEEAENLQEKALELNKELGRKEGMATTYGNLATIKRLQGKSEEAKILLTKTLRICEFFGNAYNIKKAKELIDQLENEIKNKLK